MNSRFLPLTAILLALPLSCPAEDSAPLKPLEQAQLLAQKGDVAGATKILQTEADAGNPDAENALGEMMVVGKSKTARADAISLFLKAADQSHPAAMFNAALLLYQGGDGITRDDDQGLFLLKNSAEAGYAPAQFQLGNLLDEEAAKADKASGYVEAAAWIEKAADQNHAGALYALSQYYQNGSGGKPLDLGKSTELCARAARGGTVVAMNEYGVRLQKGEGVTADPIAAIGYLSLAAQYGLAAAQTNLGNSYENGNGVRVDFNQAGGYYAAAAKQNFHAAEFLLAQLFENGRGTEVNNPKAYILYGRAAAGKIEEAAKRQEAIKSKLTENELAAADKAIADEVKKLQPAAPAESKAPEATPATTKPSEAPEK